MPHGCVSSHDSDACGLQPALATSAALLGVHPEILKRKLSYRLMTSGLPGAVADPALHSLSVGTGMAGAVGLLMLPLLLRPLRAGLLSPSIPAAAYRRAVATVTGGAELLLQLIVGSKNSTPFEIPLNQQQAPKHSPHARACARRHTHHAGDLRARLTR